MNLAIILISSLIALGLTLLFMSQNRSKREQGYQILKAGYLLSIVLVYLATGNTMLFYLFITSCLLDVFCTVLYYEAYIRKEEE